MRRRKAKKIKEDANIDLTPMLDIVFILLIFFIVSSQFGQDKGIEIDRPTASQGIAQQSDELIVTISKENEIYIGHDLILPEKLEAVLRHNLASQLQPALVIDADKMALNGTLVLVMDKAKKVGFDSISLMTETSE